MRFKKFIEETGGYFEPEETRPTGDGRVQEMPGTQMTLGQKDIQGVVMDKTVSDDKERVTLVVQDANGNVADVNIPYEKFISKDDEPPKKGDTIQVVFDRNKSLYDYKVMQRHPKVFVRTWGHQSPTSGSVGPVDQYGGQRLAAGRRP